MPPLIREMLENPEAFEDSSDSGDSTTAAPPAIQAIKQEDKAAYESPAEEEEEEEEDDYWDEEKERGADSDGEVLGEAVVGAQKKGVTRKPQWEKLNDGAAQQYLISESNRLFTASVLYTARQQSLYVTAERKMCWVQNRRQKNL